MESERRFRIIAENSSDLIMLINKHGLITYVSPSCREMLGFKDTNYIGKHFTHHVHPDDKEKMNTDFQSALHNQQNWQAEFRQLHRTNGWLWSELHGTPVFDDKNRFMHMVVLARDITMRKQYEEKLEHIAFYDYLTKLPNRLLFMRRLNEIIEGNDDNADKLAVIMMDIDQFKKYNDNFGHDVGDAIIKEFARRIKLNLRKNALAARLGGDEFVMVLPIVSTEEAAAMAQNIQKTMQGEWQVVEHTFNVTTSMGIAVAPVQSSTSHTMLKHADLALYEAKESGRNVYKIKVMPAEPSTTNN
ncbi:MAG TPA: sensor domain-containing diguanylate cyclase [Bacillota bacterium]|nr:sensor domain-containing diguanylate cyclase [Bacillota bacterium]